MLNRTMTDGNKQRMAMNDDYDGWRQQQTMTMMDRNGDDTAERSMFANSVTMAC